MKARKVLVWLLAMTMVLSMLPMSAMAADQNVVTGSSGGDAEHTDHCVCGAEHQKIGDHKAESSIAWKGVSDLSEITADGNYYLTGSVSLTAPWQCSYDVNLCLNGQTITGYDQNLTTTGGGGDAIQVQSGASLTITDCHTGDEVGRITHDENTYGRGIYNEGTLTLYNGSITGNNASSEAGCGVSNEGGTFTMYGGSITANGSEKATDGGVENSTFSYEESAVHSTFTMYGGTISGNTAGSGSGGVTNDVDCTFTMYGGTIGDNTGGGVNNNGTFTMKGGAVSGNTTGGGAGVLNQGTFTMEGGIISKNNSTSASESGGGAGVQNYNTFTMKGGTISDNFTEGNGGGIYNFGTFKMEGGSITGNSGGRIGGGICTFSYKNDAKFIMTSGTISGNTGTMYGGGVGIFSYGRANVEFTITGGSITGNNVAKAVDEEDNDDEEEEEEEEEENLFGGGVFSNVTLNVSDTPVISGNVKGGTKSDDGTYIGGTASNVYLYEDTTVTVATDGMQSGAKVYITGKEGQTLVTGTTSAMGFYCDTAGLSFVADGNGGLKLAEKTNEAQIDGQQYATLGDALKAAAGNGTADTIEIISSTVTLASDANTLEAGDTIKTYGYINNQGERVSIGEIKAIDDAALGIYADEDGGNNVKFISGTVQVKESSALLGGGVIATGKSGVEITNMSEGSDDKNVIIVAPNNNVTTSTDLVQVQSGGKVKIGDTEYENASTGTGDETSIPLIIVVTKDDSNNVTIALMYGEVKLDKGESINVGSANTAVTNSGDTTITVKANPESGKSSVVVPANKKVTIGGVEYEAGDADATFVIDTDGNVTLTVGAVKLDNGESITGVTGKAISNPTGSGSDKITVTVDAENVNDTVTVAKGEGKTVAISDVTYTNGSDDADMVIEVTADGNKLTGGAVMLYKGGVINVSTANVPVATTGDKTIILSASSDGTGKATILAGGKAKIKNTEITAAEGDVSVDINTDESLKLTVNPGKITLGGMTYTGDVELTVDKDGKVTLVKGEVTYDQSALTEDFSYDLAVGQTITIGNYVYTAPIGNVTIKGRGVDKNPTVVLKNEGTTVEVALPADRNTKTTYTAVNANTMFALSESDATTKSIELLSNGNSSATSKIEIFSGVTVDSMSDTITSEADHTVISLDSSNNAKWTYVNTLDTKS